MTVLKLLGTETQCNTTPNNFSQAGVLRAYNSNTTAPFLMTVSVNSTVNVASITIGPGESLLIRKASNNFLQSNNAAATLLVTPVGI